MMTYKACKKCKKIRPFEKEYKNPKQRFCIICFAPWEEKIK